jgi:hypothetical protein
LRARPPRAHSIEELSRATPYVLEKDWERRLLQAVSGTHASPTGSMIAAAKNDLLLKEEEEEQEQEEDYAEDDDFEDDEQGEEPAEPSAQTQTQARPPGAAAVGADGDGGSARTPARSATHPPRGTLFERIQQGRLGRGPAFRSAMSVSHRRRPTPSPRRVYWVAVGSVWRHSHPLTPPQDRFEP